MRLLLYTGKGGVGKTTIAAATGLFLAERGHRTLVMSVDPAHSLADAFDLERRLLDLADGQPVAVRENLDVQEIQVHREIERYWSEVYAYLSALLQTTGIDHVAAEELAIFPGMEELSSLLYVNHYVQENAYDVILLDCAPTGESLRFVSIPTALEWYMKRVFRTQRAVARVARPLVRQLTSLQLPEDRYFANLEELFQRLEGVEELLHDPKQTTVRLVTNPEKIVVKETQRAFMYFCLYGLTVDAVIVNRLLPPEPDGRLLEQWRAAQQNYLAEIRATFADVPIWEVPFFGEEVVGQEALRRLGEQLYASVDPLGVYNDTVPLQFLKEEGEYRIRLRLPYATAADVDLAAFGDELVVTVGNFRRHIPLPRHLAGRRPQGARRRGEAIEVYFPLDREEENGKE